MANPNYYGGGPKLLNLPTILVNLLAILVVLCLQNSSVVSTTTTTDPLKQTDVIKAYRVGNHFQCERLCWYRKLCARFSFYDKRDAPGGEHTDNCVLHAFNGSDSDVLLQEPLLEGWTSRLASGENLPPGNTCKARSCGDLHVCVPVKGSSHTCIMDTKTDMNDCASSPCLNGGTCQDLINQYNCTCAYGFAGNNCQIDLYWLNDACTTNGECTLDAKAVCNGGRCVCDGSTGFFFAHSTNKCVAVCSKFHPTVYTHYVQHDFLGHDAWKIQGVTINNCTSKCSADNTTCMQFAWVGTQVGSCWGKPHTAQEFPSAWLPNALVEVYQKTCV